MKWFVILSHGWNTLHIILPKYSIVYSKSAVQKSFYVLYGHGFVYGCTLFCIWLYVVLYMVVCCFVYGCMLFCIWLYVVLYTVVCCFVYGCMLFCIWLYVLYPLFNSISYVFLLLFLCILIDKYALFSIKGSFRLSHQCIINM